MSQQQANQAGALVKQPIRLIAIHRGQKLMDQVFQHTPIRIGRLLDNDVVLPFDFASRYHCEIRFENGQWTAVDLGSKNGILLDATTRAPEIKMLDGGNFRVQEVTIQLMFETPAEVAKDFHALRENVTIIAPDEPMPAMREVSPATEKPSKTQAKTTTRHHKEKIRPDHHQAATGKRPMINYDVNQGLLNSHPSIGQAKERAIQMIVMWHDQVLEVREIPIGLRVVWNFLGDNIDLGGAKSDKTQIKIPKGCTPIGNGGPNSVTLTHDTPCAFRASETLMVAFRYVPRSKVLPGNVNFVEDRLVEPMIMSGVIHGAAALTAIIVAPKHHIKEVEEPERFARIIVAPTPIQVALQPTPTPVPTPMATPTPPEIAKLEEKPTPPPKRVVKIEKKKIVRRKVAQARSEDPGPKHEEKPVVKVATEEPPNQQQKVEVEPIPEPPAPAPTPVFNAKKVGVLAGLNMLNAGPASNLANVEKINVSRAPASVGSVYGREAVSGTGDMESKLNQSAKGGGTGKGVGTDGIAVGGKDAGGKYNVAGLAGKAGKRKIRGTVVGGATYNELSKNEGLTKEQVMKVVMAHQSEIQACYEKSLMVNPDLTGDGGFEWEITPKGKVTVVSVKNATLRNGENLLDCVKGVFYAMQFPKAKNGEGTTPTIVLPFGKL